MSPTSSATWFTPISRARRSMPGRLCPWGGCGNRTRRRLRAMSTAGYSGTPLPRKLGIRDGCRLLLVDAPAAFAGVLGELPPGVQAVEPGRGRRRRRRALRGRSRVVARAVLGRGGPPAACRGPLGGVAQAQLGDRHRSDENAIRELGLDAGLVDNKVCAIDATWSGLRFVVRRARSPGTLVNVRLGRVRVRARFAPARRAPRQRRRRRASRSRATARPSA